MVQKKSKSKVITLEQEPRRSDEVGGKGSGRPKGSYKPLVLLISELEEQVRLLNDNCETLHKKVDRVTARWRYWLLKQKKQDYRRKRRRLHTE